MEAHELQLALMETGGEILAIATRLLDSGLMLPKEARNLAQGRAEFAEAFEDLGRTLAEVSIYRPEDAKAIRADITILLARAVTILLLAPASGESAQAAHRKAAISRAKQARSKTQGERKFALLRAIEQARRPSWDGSHAYSEAEIIKPKVNAFLTKGGFKPVGSRAIYNHLKGQPKY